MKIIYQTKNIFKSTNSFLFGLKGLSTLENEKSLEEIKSLKNDNVYLSIDKNLFNQDLKLLEEVLKKIDNYNIKGIFFYDLAVLSLAKKLGIKTNLIWNQNFLVTNYKTCNYYAKEGVKGTVLSSEITIEEIEEISKNTNMTLFVNIFGYQLMALSKRQLLTSYYDNYSIKTRTKTTLISEKENNYPVMESEIGTKFYTNKILNGIIYLNKLKSCNIDYIILNDIGLEQETFQKIVRIYEQVIDKDISDESLKKEEEKISKIIPNTSTLFLNKKTIYKVKRK